MKQEVSLHFADIVISYNLKKCNKHKYILMEKKLAYALLDFSSV